MNHTLASEFAPLADARRRLLAWIGKVDQFARPAFGGERCLFGDDRAADHLVHPLRRHTDHCPQRHTRRQLAAADYRILQDIGISEAERDIEVNKYFWEA